MKKNIFRSLLEKSGRVKYNLTHINTKEPLGLFSLTLLLLLDLFILTAVFEGLDEHTRQLTTPEAFIPPICREIIIDRKWSGGEALTRLSAATVNYSKRYEEPGEDFIRNYHPLCRALFNGIKQIAKNPETLELLKTKKELHKETESLQEELQGVKGSYETYLLQQIAKTPGLKESDVAPMKKEFQRKTLRLNFLMEQTRELDQKLFGNSLVSGLLHEIEKSSGQQKALEDDYKKQLFFYPFKKALMQMIFLLPLLFLFYLWHSSSFKKENGLQALISSHLLIVAAIPSLLVLFETLYEIIPKVLLKKIWELLVSLHLIAIWHYLIILLSVAAGVAVIYFFQKKIFSRQKQLEKRVAKGMCIDCGKLLPHGSHACPFCGFVQNKDCASCRKPTPVAGKYCIECGALQEGV